MSYNPTEIPDDIKRVAEKFFERGQTVAETRNYDYAIELYLQGLAKNPEDTKKGHQPLREIAFKRMVLGGKKAGIIETIKRSTGKKSPLEAMLNAEYFLAKDPLNVTYAESIVKSADKAELPESLRWSLGVLLELARQEKKAKVSRLLLIKNLSEKLGEHYEKNDQADCAIECYQRGLEALETGIEAGVGSDHDFVGIQRNLAGKLTILRGKYDNSENFRDSIQNAEKQKEYQDKSRIVKGKELLSEMIDKARAELAQNPDVTGTINNLVDLLMQRGRPEDAKEAIDVLEKAYKKSEQYSYKMRADDVRIRHLTGKVRQYRDQLSKSPEDEELKSKLKEARIQLAKFELDVFAERISQYPTDRKLKFEYAKRLFKVQKYDDAIPFFQEASADPRYSVRAKYHIGTCFYQKGWYQQAIDILNEAIENHESSGDTTSKEMHYVLGRAYEDNGNKEECIKIYSKLIQWDYNFRDVRKRLDTLQKKE